MYDPEKMPLTAVLKEWLEAKEWEDEVEILNDGQSSRVSTSFSIEGQSHKCYLECEEARDSFEVYFYPPYSVPEARIKDAAVLLNRINCRLLQGRLVCSEGDLPGRIQFKNIVDVEGTELSVKQIGLMISTGLYAFEQFGGVMSAVALTKYPVDKIWQEFLDAEAEEEKKKENEGPKEL